jgi:Tetratricopeptide repeat
VPPGRRLFGATSRLKALIEANAVLFCLSDKRTGAVMEDIDTSYKVLGLTPGASEAQVRLAHKDLLDRLYPDLLSPNSTLRKSARERILEVNEAFDELMLHATATASKEPISAPAVLGTQGLEPSSLEGGASRENALEPGLPPADNIAPGYIPPALGALVLLLCVGLFRVSGVGGTLLAIISGAAGWLAGHALVKGVNTLKAPRRHKTAVAWMTTALLFVVVISLPMLSNKSSERGVQERKQEVAVKPSQRAVLPESTQENEKERSPLETGNLSGKASNPLESASWLSKGKELILAGKYAEAIDALTKSIALNPADDAAYNSRGVAFAYSHEYGKAIDDYNRAIELNPEGDGAYYLNRGIVCVARENYQQAIKDYKKAAQLGNKEAQDFFDSQNIVW